MSISKITNADFEQKVIKSKELTIVDFWAPWCAPCRMLNPVIEKLSKAYNRKVNFFKLNLDENKNIAAKYQILSIPTLLFFKNGKIQGQITGVKREADIKKTIESLL